MLLHGGLEERAKQMTAGAVALLVVVVVVVVVVVIAVGYGSGGSSGGGSGGDVGIGVRRETEGGCEWQRVMWTTSCRGRQVAPPPFLWGWRVTDE
jgi:hypothetical protein